MFRSGFARCPLDGSPLAAIADDPLEGSTFADRYLIEACVGEGGMGRVYRARHQRVTRRFAIKVLFGDHAAEKKMQERFAREAEAACRLSHPNVVSVLDFGETDAGLCYLVMDWIEGRDLSDVISEQAPLDADRVARLTRQLCHGLAHAHDNGLVHRDFKGENVIVTRDGDREVPRIVDFGIAVLHEGEGSERLTTEGIVLGTPAYMSPEQATGVALDHRTDLFSLGVLIYEMLAGVLPFEGPPIAIARQNLAADPPPITQRVPGLAVDQRLEAIAMRLMAKRPDDRFGSARQVLEALDERERAGHAPLAVARTVRATGREPTVPARSRAPLLVALVATLLAALGLGVIALRGGADAPAPVAAAIADAGAVTTTPPIDAAPVVVVAAIPAADATPAAAPTRGRPARRRPPRERQARHQPQPTADAAAPRPAPRAELEITRTDLQSLYVAVGKRIDQLARDRGEEAARAFRDEYFRVPFADALRTPSLRAEVHATLRALRRRVDAELDR